MRTKKPRKTAYDKFMEKLENLAPGFIIEMDRASRDELLKKSADLTLQSDALRQAKEDDKDYQEKKAALKAAGAMYAEAAKAFKLKAQYLRSRLRGIGADVPEAEDFAGKTREESAS